MSQLVDVKKIIQNARQDPEMKHLKTVGKRDEEQSNKF